MSVIQVLVIDDEETNVKVKLQPLEQYFPTEVNFVPVFVGSVVEALAKLVDRTRFDAVFLDIGDVDPKRDAIQQIRQVHPYVPIVMFSKHKKADVILEYLDLGARTFIPKEDLPSEVLSETGSIREDAKEMAREIVRRIRRLFDEYQPVKRLLGRSLENGTVRKSGPPDELKDQIRFLQEIAKVRELAPFFPHVADSKVMEYAAYYEMPFFDMKDLYKFLLSEQFSESCKDVARTALTAVIEGPFLLLSRHSRQTELSPDVVQVLFYHRFQRRVQEVRDKLQAAGDAAEPGARDFARLLDCNCITVGGEPLQSPGAILKEIENDPTLYARLKPTFLSWVHGDLHFKNILLDDRLPRMMEVKLVDPKGAGIGDPAYDLGKLLFSSRGLGHLIEDQLYRPSRMSMKFSNTGEVEVEAFEKIENERAPVPGGLSRAYLSSYRPSVQEWIWDVFATLGQYVKEGVELTDYPKGDPDWWLRACLYEGLHFCCMAPMLVEKVPEVAINLFLRGTELLNRFLEDYRKGQFPV